MSPKDQTDVQRFDPADLDLATFEGRLLAGLDTVGLPSADIVVPVRERHNALSNLRVAIEPLSDERRATAVYISKFAAAIASGLFDAALNYLWDETVLELRRRVAQYDIDYFFDNAVQSTSRRNGLKSADDLEKITDDELIKGARAIGLISAQGLQHLEYVRYQRNWASAAHPNQNQLTGLQLVSWLETCIREVINLPMSNVAVEIRKLLSNIKTASLSASDAAQVGVFLQSTPTDQCDRLLAGIFGLYVADGSPVSVRDNIHILAPVLWPYASDDAKHELGLKYARYIANNDTGKRDLARQILELVDGLGFAPEGVRAIEIQRAVESLLAAHRASMNNFHLEPPAARALSALVTNNADGIPASVRVRYVFGVIEPFLTNGNGVAWNAEPYYLRMIRGFSSDEAVVAMLSLLSEHIANRLQFGLCAKKYRELLAELDVKLTAASWRSILADLQKATDAQLPNLRSDTRFRGKADPVFRSARS